MRLIKCVGRWALGVVACVFLILVGGTANAACVSTQSFSNSGKENRFSVHYPSFYEHLGLTPSVYNMQRVSGVIQRSMRIWHDGAPGGWFERECCATVPNLLTESHCSAMAGRSLIRMATPQEEPSCSYALAYISPRCNNTSWEMVICSDNDWLLNGEPSWSGVLDIGQTIAHEFGHALGLFHPSLVDGEAAVMQPTLESMGLIRQRNLYRYDVQCMHELAGNGPSIRKTSVYVSRQTASGGFGTATKMTNGPYKGSVHAKRPSDSSTAEHRTALFSNGALMTYAGYTSGTNGSGYNAGPVSTIPVVTTLSELAEANYVFFGRNSGSGWTSRNNMYVYLYGDNYSSTPYVGVMQACEHGVCSSIASAHRPSVTYDEVSDKSVSAWTTQTRQLVNDKHDLYEDDVYLAIGSSWTSLYSAETTLVKSSYGPSVACEPYKAYGGFDCILAYISRDDYIPTVRFKFFYVVLGSDVYSHTVQWSSHEAFGPTAVGSPAIWYHRGLKKWYLAALLSDSSGVALYTSASGATWTFVSHLGRSVTSPIVNQVFSWVAAAVSLSR